MSYINKRIKKFAGEDKTIKNAGACYGFGVQRFEMNLQQYLIKQESGLSQKQLERLEYDKFKHTLNEVKKKRKEYNLTLIKDENE